MKSKTFIKGHHTLSKSSGVDDTRTSKKTGALPESPQSALPVYLSGGNSPPRLTLIM